MASNTFRDSMNSLGWSRRDPDIPVTTTSSSTPILSRLQSLNPFSDGGYVRLPTQEGPGAPLPAPSRREEEEGFFARKSTPFFIHNRVSSWRDGGYPSSVRDRCTSSCVPVFVTRMASCKLPISLNPGWPSVPSRTLEHFGTQLDDQR